MGVDVFFVISGYLMTGIILSGLTANNFSLANFYLARVKRIVPALLILCTTLLAIAWFLPLTGDEYQTLAKHVRDSSLFISNRSYARESGYFDSAAHEKWLLHTWSLSVEWQFYILLPFILLAGHRWLKQKQAQGLLLGGLFLLSLTLCIYKTSYNPVDAFYRLPSRAWEMLAGGLLYIYAPQLNILRRYSTALSMIGLAVLLGCIAGFNTAMAWPSWNALIPVIATVLILAGSNENSRLFNNRAFQWLGTRSYSVYLWHWPLVVALWIYGWQAEPQAQDVAFLLAIVLGAISYQWVEMPSRLLSGKYSKRVIWLTAFTSVIVVSGSATLIGKQDTLAWRLDPPAVQLVEKMASNTAPWRDDCWNGKSTAGCIYGKQAVGAMMVGDSHAGSTINAVAIAASSKDLGVRFWGKTGCMTVFDTPNDENGNQCIDFNALLKSETVKNSSAIPLIIVNRASLYPHGPLQGESNRWGIPIARLTNSQVLDRPTTEFLAEYRRRLISTACHYASQRPVYYVKPVPEFGFSVPKTISKQIMRNGKNASELTIPVAEYYKRNAFILSALEEAKQRCGVRLLDPLPYLCPKGECMGSYQGIPLYTDGNHLNEYGNRFLIPMFSQVFDRKS